MPLSVSARPPQLIDKGMAPATVPAPLVENCCFSCCPGHIFPQNWGGICLLGTAWDVFPSPSWRRIPFPLHPRPDGDSCPAPNLQRPVPNPTAAAEESITVRLARILHLQMLPTVRWQCSDVENLLQQRNVPSFWFLLQRGCAGAQSGLMACFAVKLVDGYLPSICPFD